LNFILTTILTFNTQTTGFIYLGRYRLQLRNIDAALQQFLKKVAIMIKIAISCNMEIGKKEGLRGN